MKSPDSGATESDPAVAAIRLMHRRRGWIWATVISVVAFVVDGVAYLAGAENTAVFTPTSSGQICGRGGCHTVTNGYLGTASLATPVTWPGQVPLGQPFTVRQPLWNWAWGSQLINGDGSAIAYIVVGVLIDGFCVFILFAMYKVVRQWLRRRREPISGLATG